MKPTSVWNVRGNDSDRIRQTSEHLRGVRADGLWTGVLGRAAGGRRFRSDICRHAAHSAGERFGMQR